MRAKLLGVDRTFAYSIHLCAGVITWGLFGEVVGRSRTMFLDNKNLLKKISFLNSTLLIILVANAGLDFAILFGIFGLFGAFLVVSCNFQGWHRVGIVAILARSANIS